MINFICEIGRLKAVFIGFDAFYNYAEKMSPLGNASAEECANYCVFLFSEMSKKITMQNLFHDGGFSNTGISEEIIDQFK